MISKKTLSAVSGKSLSCYLSLCPLPLGDVLPSNSLLESWSQDDLQVMSFFFDAVHIHDKLLRPFLHARKRCQCNVWQTECCLGCLEVLSEPLIQSRKLNRGGAGSDSKLYFHRESVAHVEI